MKLLILSGIACDSTIWEKTDLKDHELTFLDYKDYMNEHTKTVEDIAHEILKDSSLTLYDGIIAHSMGGFVGVILLDARPSLARFFIDIETSFVPAEQSYRTLLYGKDLTDRIEKMFQSEIKHYPKELITFLRGAFDYEDMLKKLSVPKTLIYGKRDMIEEELHHKLNLSKETIDGLELIFIDEAAHFPMLEQPSKTNEVLKKTVKNYS